MEIKKERTTGNSMKKICFIVLFLLSFAIIASETVVLTQLPPNAIIVDGIVYLLENGKYVAHPEIFIDDDDIFDPPDL